MTNDARISVGLPSHPKTKKLIRRLGQASAWNLVCLILWAASNRSDGDLCGMTAEDIELAADWQGNGGAFVAALSELRFLDGQDGEYMLHDWHEHNPWAAGSEMRRAKARWNATKRYYGEAEADRVVPEYAAIRTATSKADSKTLAEGQHPDSTAPTPIPIPIPTPTSEEPKGSVASKLPTCPMQAVIDLYHETLPELPAVRLLNDQRRKATTAFWRWVLTSKRTDGTPRAQTSDQALTYIRNYFERARDNDFLMGRVEQAGKFKNWQCDFDFLLTEKGKKHVIEKTLATA